jgi:hypothetical protein
MCVYFIGCKNLDEPNEWVIWISKAEVYMPMGHTPTYNYCIKCFSYLSAYGFEVVRQQTRKHLP